MDDKNIIYPLKKHSYPLKIQVFFAALILLSIHAMSSFFIYEYPVQNELYQDMVNAKKYFDTSDNYQALQLYNKILKKFPSLKECKAMAAKASFVLSKTDLKFYVAGLNYLAEESYDRDEINEFESFLPEELKDDFRSRLSSARFSLKRSC